jgi:hypothetical protein
MADGLELSELVRRTVQANAKLYKGWVDLSLEYFRGISEIFGGFPDSASSPTPEMDAGAGVLVMEGEDGATVHSAFLVTNDLGRVINCEFVATDFADPAGATVRTKVAFDPPAVQLAPGEQRVIQVAIPIDPELVPGVGYSAEASIKGMEGFAVPLVVRRQHRVEHVNDDPADKPLAAQPPNEPEPRRPAETPPVAKPAAARKAARKKSSARPRRSS